MFEWSSIASFRENPAFDAAWSALDTTGRASVQRALSHATTAALVFIRSDRAAPTYWDGLDRAIVEPLELAVRTSLALGVYRANLASSVGSARTPLSDAATRAASSIEARSLQLCVRRLAEHEPRLARVDALRPTAFHQVVANLQREHEDTVRFAEACIGASIALDDLFVAHGSDVTRVIGPQRSVRKRIATTARSLQVPAAGAAAIWALALRGRCDVYGQEEDTQSYSDDSSGDFDLAELVDVTEG